MPILEPSDAVYAANNVYNIMNDSDLSLFGTKLDNKFNIASSSRFEGVAGAMMFKYQSGFGLAAKGVGKYKDEALIVVRGTVDLLRDLVLTDGNVGLKRSVTGNNVHAGFHNVFRSFENDLRKFFKGYNPRRVHCVGHSLGGGIATLIAEWIQHHSISQPMLYTFGCPRVGFEGFANSLTSQIGANNIYRAYHRTDVVSMIPLWPFLHVPQPGVECFIESPGLVPGITYHKMDKYLTSIRKSESWDELKRREPSDGLDAQIEAWLESSSPLTLSANTIFLVDRALLFVLKKVLHLTGIVVQGLLTTGITLLDKLAMAIEQAARISKEISGYVISLMKKMLRALGILTVDTSKLTADLISWVLRKFSSAVYRMAMEALRIVHIK